MKNIIVILFFSFVFLANAQENDTTEVRKSPEIEFAEMTKSPTGALVRSLILPGWGQIYVENYWKAPLMAGGFIGVGSAIVWNHNNYREAVNEIDAFAGEDGDYELRVLRNKRDFYRDQRDMMGLYLLGVYLIAAVDSYVGAHLYDFNVDDNLSLGVMPDRFGYISLQIRYKLK